MAVPLACDFLINHSFDIVFEDMVELKQFAREQKILMICNFATTAPPPYVLPERKPPERRNDFLLSNDGLEGGRAKARVSQFSRYTRLQSEIFRSYRKPIFTLW